MEEKKRKNPFIVLLKAEWEFLGNKKKTFLFYMFLFVIAGTISLMTPLLLGHIFNSIQNEITTKAELNNLILLITLLLPIGIFYWLFHGTARIIEGNTGFAVGKNYNNQKIREVLELPMSWHKDNHSGDTIDKINKSTSAISNFAQHMTFQLVYVIINLIGSAIILSFFDVKAAVIAFIFSVSIMVLITKFDKKLRTHYKEKNKLENKASASIYDYISNIVTVKTLSLKKVVRKEISTKLGASYEPHKKAIILNEIKWGFASIAIKIMVVVLLAFRAYNDFYSSGLIMVGTIFILHGYLNKMGETFYTIAKMYGEITRYGANIENAEEIEIEHTKIKSQIKENIPSNWNKVQINNLNFTYTNAGSVNHLHNMKFNFRKGEKIALVGESGSGKSTLLAILRGLYEPDTVQISVDNTIVKNGLKSLKENITLIPQDPEIFNNTIKFNVTMGLHYAPKDILKSIQMAQFAPVIKRLNKGINTNVMEKGISLSGGEKQRLALARGLLAAKTSEIILMDEPTSSVDSANELQIHNNIFSTYKKKTIISSIHRLHLLNKFDTIYFFERGKIIASGTLEEMKEIPKFTRLLQKYRNDKKE